MIKPGKRIEIRDEGSSQGYAQAVNFTGAGVSASQAAGVATVNIPGGAGGEIAPNNMTPSSSQTIAAGYSLYVSDFFEIAAGLFAECGAEAVLEIG